MLLRKVDVVDGALALLETEGLDGFTTRKLGDALGVRASALYRHYPDKRALLDAMANRILEKVNVDLPTGPWDQQGTALADRLRQVLLAHRDGARVVAGAYSTEPSTVLFGNTAVEVLRRAGLSPEQAGWATAAVSHYVLGHTIEEQARADLAAHGTWTKKMDAFTDLQDQVATTTFDADPAERFAFGLRLIVNGIRHELDQDRTA
jgi:AcrR family transcriptional regulator